MNLMKWSFLVSVALFVVPAQVASADVTQQIDFTFNTQVTSPQNLLSGSITVVADETNNFLPSQVVSIDLNIDGHQYTVAEVGISASGSTATIGGTINGAGIVFGSTEDFSITYVTTTGAPSFFPLAFATPTTGPWNSVPPVPEFTVTTLPQAPSIEAPGLILLVGGLIAALAGRLPRRGVPG